MTIKECYDAMGADYQNTLNRFPNEAFIKKFVLKFLDDNSYANLKEAIAAGNVEEAFRAAHTLKGVCLNLGFDNLYKASSAITEIFRAGELAGAEEAFEEVEKQYNITVNARETVCASRDDQQYVPVTEDETDGFCHEVMIPILAQGDIIGAVRAAEEGEQKWQM